jgi:putative transposase
VRKGQRRLAGLDEKIVAQYAGGMTIREIEAYISEGYGPGISRETVSRVTEGVLEDAKAWQTRPLERIYLILDLDALMIKIRDGRRSETSPAIWRSGSTSDASATYSGCGPAHRRRQVLAAGPHRPAPVRRPRRPGLLRGRPDRLPEAIEAVYPNTWVQTCRVHLVRSSLRFVPYRGKRKVAADLKRIYAALDRDHAEHKLEPSPRRGTGATR